MCEASARPTFSARLHPALPAAGMALAAALLSLHALARIAAPSEWPSLLLAPDFDDMGALLVTHGFLPRIAVAWLAGAALALAGTLAQQALNNPLAEPTTLGVSAGAWLALSAATLFAPAALDYGREWVAVAGGGTAMLLVLALAWGRELSPLALILAGLIVTLVFGALNAVLVIFHHTWLRDLFVWQSGSLSQNGWSIVLYLLPRLCLALAASLLLLRPLGTLSLGDAGARSLGLSPAIVRAAALAVAVGLGAFVVSAVGVIGLVGLAAPALARFCGARTIRDRIIWGTLAGAGLLWLADQLVLNAAAFAREVPTGAATALAAGPLMLLLLRGLQQGRAIPRSEPAMPVRLARPGAVASALCFTALILLLPAICFGQGPEGWEWLGWSELEPLLQWRLPRATAALAAGAMLAMAGAVMQRMTGNPMASPEVLGVTSGVSLGVVLTLMSGVAFDRGAMFASGAAGAVAALALVLWMGRGSAFAPERMLFAGIALGSVLTALVSVLMATGDPRFGLVMSWMAGSTYRVTAQDAVAALAMMAVGGATLALASRWLAVLPLGDDAARSLGVSIAASRLLLLAAVALLSAAATLIVGPLSFVGLMAPHMARMAGFTRPLTQLAAAAALGAAIMVAADWLGRNIAFPWIVPAGLLATCVGAPYFIFLLRRQQT